MSFRMTHRSIQIVGGSDFDSIVRVFISMLCVWVKVSYEEQ